jgi:hypothetical protein
MPGVQPHSSTEGVCARVCCTNTIKKQLDYQVRGNLLGGLPVDSQEAPGCIEWLQAERVSALSG